MPVRHKIGNSFVRYNFINSSLQKEKRTEIEVCDEEAHASVYFKRPFLRQIKVLKQEKDMKHQTCLASANKVKIMLLARP